MKNGENFREIVKNEGVRKLFSATKMSHPLFFTDMVKVFNDQQGRIVRIERDDDNTYVIYEPEGLFTQIFGPIKMVFRGNKIKSINLTDISPKEYLYDIYRSGCHEYKGVVIPNLDKYKFKVDYVLAKNKLK